MLYIIPYTILCTAFPHPDLWTRTTRNLGAGADRAPPAARAAEPNVPIHCKPLRSNSHRFKCSQLSMFNVFKHDPEYLPGFRKKPSNKQVSNNK